MKNVKKNRHPFRFKIEDEDQENVFTVWAKVKRATKIVELILTADDVRRSLELNGTGNTQKCAMAVCAKRQKEKFPHPVEGYIDWSYKSAHVVETVDRKNGRVPKTCVGYEHNDKVARLFDTPAGMKKLLRELEIKGAKTIRLYPPRRQDTKQYKYPKTEEQTRRLNAHERTGERGSQVKSLKGAKLRFAVAQLGAVPA